MARTVTVTWRLRLTAASRGIWKASQFQELLRKRGERISAGKLSRLWSPEAPVSVKLADLALFCSVLDCGVEDLLVVEVCDRGPELGPAPATAHSTCPNQIKGRPAPRGTPGAVGPRHRTSRTGGRS
jgi:DNA-binding Xre family transcriptional regulator